ncbi:hypothetical protein VTN96DRAFT_8420 [Rasamsonia emersonii]
MRRRSTPYRNSVIPNSRLRRRNSLPSWLHTTGLSLVTHAVPQPRLLVRIRGIVPRVVDSTRRIHPASRTSMALERVWECDFGSADRPQAPLPVGSLAD